MDPIVIPLAALTGVATLAGGWIALRLHHSLPAVIALSGGIVVAVALLDVLPEAIESVGDTRLVMSLVAVGFVAFFLAQKALVLHHRDEEDQAKAHHRVGAFGALGLSAHSFVDGLGIGLAFGLDSATGFLVFIAVISHDFADGLNTVSFVLRQSNDRRAAIRWLALDAAAPIAGAIIGSSLAISDASLGKLLALYAGFFLSMGATDLLPEAHAHSSWKRVALTISGFMFVWAITVVAGV